VKNSLTHQIDSGIYQRDMAKDDKEKDEQVQILVRIPKDVDAILDADAKLNKRSKKGHVEAILEAYYELYSGDVRDLVEIRSRLSPVYKKPSGDKPETGQASENKKKNNSHLVITKSKKVYPEMTTVQMWEYLQNETGRDIPIAAVLLYDEYVQFGKQAFFEQNYPTEIQEIVAAFFAGTLDGYLSKEKQRLAE